MGKYPSKPVPAAFATVLPDKERYVAEFASNLLLLWQRFNQRHDYPLLIFSEGLHSDTKRRLVRASPCRLWFYIAEDLLHVPAELTEDPRSDARLRNASHVSLGYRAQARWKAGPMFKHPVFTTAGGIKYIWWLDYDSYLPGEQREDPFLYLHERQLLFAWTHWGVDARASSRHFWEYTRMYMHAAGIGPEDSFLLRDVHVERAFRGRVMMNDNEILRTDWFAEGPYFDYFTYLDSLQGIWMHRWGDHLVRTFGIAMHMPETRMVQLTLPYAHQEICMCGAERPGLRCVRTDDPARPWKGWRWHCEP